MISIRNCERGFTLIEVLVAIAILTIGILSVFSMQIASVKGNATASRLTTASSLAADRAEKILGMDYDLDLVDDVDQNGGNYGLDDMACCPGSVDPIGVAVAVCNEIADQCFSTDDYWIFVNIAEDVAMPNTKSIRILVRRLSEPDKPPVVVNYLKGKYF